MNDNKENKMIFRNKMILIISIVSLLIVVSGITYAWFSNMISGRGKDITIVTAKLGISYTDTSPEVSLLSALPGESVTKTFTVKNISQTEDNPEGVTTHYEIYWKDLLNTFINDELVYTIEREGYEASEERLLEEEIIESNIEITPGTTHYYELTIHFKETGLNQNSNMGAKFSGLIQIRENTRVIAQAESTYNSITVSAKVENPMNRIIGYSFSKDDGETWTSEQTSNTYTFTGLIDATIYDIKVRTTNELNAVSISEKLEKTTNLPPMKDIQGGIYTNSFLGISTDGYLYEWGGGLKVPTKVSSTFKAKAISVGTNYYMAIGEDDYLYGWGNNSYGQLGLGDIQDRSTLTRITAIGKVKAVSAGWRHTIAILENGDVYNWGDSQYGRLGDGVYNYAQVLTPKRLGTLKAKQVSAGMYQTLLLTETGELYAWGLGSDGEIGTGNTYAQLTPYLVPTNIGTISQIYAGNQVSAVINTTGELYITGKNTSGQQGNGNTTSVLSFTKVAGVSNVSQVAIGENFTTVLKTNGEIYSFGTNNYGQLGTGNTTNSYTPIKSISGTNISNKIKLVANNNTTAVLTNDNSVYTWGSNTENQLGNGTINYETAPRRVMGNVKKVVSPTKSVFALTLTNDLYRWGDNLLGVLGTGNIITQNIPVKFDVKVKDVSSKSSNSGFTDMNNNLYVFGANSGCGLGIGTNDFLPHPTPTINNTGLFTSQVMEINYVGGSVIDNTGDLWIWGAYATMTPNGYVCIPEKKTGVPKLSQLANSNYALLALDINGDLWTWGADNSNYVGQLGNGTFDNYANHLTPIKINTQLKFKYINGSGSAFMAVTTTGEVYQWGSSIFGTETCSQNAKCNTSLTKINGLSNIETVSGSSETFSAIDSNNDLYIWGNAYYGDEEEKKTLSTPTKVLLSNVGKTKSVEVGVDFISVINMNNELYMWGHNGFGELGNGFLTYSAVPTKIISS